MSFKHINFLAITFPLLVYSLGVVVGDTDETKNVCLNPYKEGVCPVDEDMWIYVPSQFDCVKNRRQLCLRTGRHWKTQEEPTQVPFPQVIHCQFNFAW